MRGDQYEKAVVSQSPLLQEGETQKRMINKLTMSMWKFLEKNQILSLSCWKNQYCLPLLIGLRHPPWVVVSCRRILIKEIIIFLNILLSLYFFKVIIPRLCQILRTTAPKKRFYKDECFFSKCLLKLKFVFLEGGNLPYFLFFLPQVINSGNSFFHLYLSILKFFCHFTAIFFVGGASIFRSQN